MPTVAAGWCGAWIVAVGTLALRLLPGPRPVDDAYITFRYARNLARGVGLVYNPGQAVLGTSTPLFAVTLGALAALTGVDLPWAAVVLSALADAVTVLLIYRLGLGIGLPVWSALLCSTAWCLYPVAFRYAVGGMETSLAAALAVGACAFHLAGRETGAIAVAGLAVLARPDMLALAAVLLVAQALGDRRLPWRRVATLAAVLSPWLIYASWRYGTPVPQSLYAKSQGVYLTPGFENTLQILYYVSGLVLAGPVGLAATGLAVYLPPEKRAVPIVVAVVLLVLCVIGAGQALRAAPRAAPVVALAPLFCAVYALIGLRGNLMAEWYLVPLAPFLLLALFAGIARSCRALGGAAHRPLAVVLSGLVVAAQGAGLEPSREPRWNLLPRIARTEREDLYRRAADFLRPRLEPGDIVAAAEIGALGYHCDCRILDTVGLVSPEAVRYYPLARALYVVNYAVAPELIREAAPAYLVSLDVFVRRSLEGTRWFPEQYEAAWEAETTVFGSHRLVVYRRISPPGGARGSPPPRWPDGRGRGVARRGPMA